MSDTRQHDPLLLDTLRELRAGVTELRNTQSEMKDRLYAMDDRLDQKLADAVKPLSARVSTLEEGSKDLERKAKQWGALGGASAVVMAGLTAVIGLFGKAVTGGK